MGTFNEIENDGNNDFIWSPISVVTVVQRSDRDWTNGYGVSGLPSTNLTTETLKGDVAPTVQPYTYDGQIFKKGDVWTFRVPPIQGAVVYLMDLWNENTTAGPFWENNRDDRAWSYDGTYTLSPSNPKYNEAVCNSNVRFESRGYTSAGWTDSRWVTIRIECPAQPLLSASVIESMWGQLANIQRLLNLIR